MVDENMEDFLKRTTLTDEQYMRILYKIREVVNAEDFKPDYYDSTLIGDKYTTSNCGFCNDRGENGFTEADTAYWPDQFPERTDMKHMAAHQKCPFDVLPTPKKYVECGCFYRCFLFHGKTYGQEKIDEIRKLVDARIKEWSG